MDETSVGTRSRRRAAPKQKFSPTADPAPPPVVRKTATLRTKSTPVRKPGRPSLASKKAPTRNGKKITEIQVKEEQKSPSPVPSDDTHPPTNDTTTASTSQSSLPLLEVKPEPEDLEIPKNGSHAFLDIKPEPLEDEIVPSPPRIDRYERQTEETDGEDEEMEEDEPTCSTVTKPVCTQCSGPLDAVPTLLVKSDVTKDGDNVTIGVLLAGKLDPSEVKWIDNKKPLEPSESIAILTQKLDEHEDRDIILTTITLPAENLKQLTLTAADLTKDFSFKSAAPAKKDQLAWVEKPSIDISDNNELILRGVVHTTKTPKIVWTKDGKAIKPGRIIENNRKMKDGQYKCEIRLVKVKRDKDEGTYQVEVRSDDRVLTGKIGLTFQKNAKPWLVRKPRIDEATNKSGVDFIVFTVIFGAIVEPTVKWFRERRNREPKLLSGRGRKKFTVKPTDRTNVYEATLRIRQHRPIDSGSYCCQITTSGGQCEAKLLAKITAIQPKKKKVDPARKALKEKKLKRKEAENHKNGRYEPEKNSKKRKIAAASPAKPDAKKKKIS